MSINNLRSQKNFGTMSGMRTCNQNGFINVLLIPLIVAVVFFIAAISFGVWAYNGRQDYKNHSDKKVAQAVTVAQQATQKVDAAKYAEEAKNPFKTHVGPSAYGGISIQYPKTWSAYVIEHTDNGGVPMNDYFHPDVVPDVADQNNSFALRVQVVTQAYSQVMAQFTGSAQTKKVTVAPYSLPKVPSVIGSRVDGQITSTKQGSMIVLPLRNVTLEISTESDSFENDFNTIILPNIAFSP
ncbi:MAG TPA: hypothetical protein VMR45_02220 [Patescibacteria group bacterium]|nr:hypothetical protein [Patescibacteria group bacterium]